MLGTITLRLYINWGILVLHGESATSITNTQKLLNCHTTCCRELVVGVEMWKMIYVGIPTDSRKIYWDISIRILFKPKFYISRN